MARRLTAGPRHPINGTTPNANPLTRGPGRNHCPTPPEVRDGFRF